MKRIQRKIRPAIDAVEKQLKKNGQVAGEYDGYASSFGASVVQSGLLPTLTFYSDGDKAGRGEVKRQDLLKAMSHLLKVLSQDNLSDYQWVTGTSLLKDVLKEVYDGAQLNNEKLMKIQRELVDASIAIKLALRNYKSES